MRAHLWLIAGCLFVGAAGAQSAGAAGTASEERASLEADPPIDEVVVTGEFPGPGMWKVTRSDDPSGHALWIVSEPSILPKDWKWKSREVEAKAASAQEILWSPAFSVTTDEKVGLFRALSLVPAALKARKNPEGVKLADILPADLHERWRMQKKLYLGRDGGIEKWRPLFAAYKLRDAAFKELGMAPNGSVSGVVGHIAHTHKIKSTTPQLEFKIKRSEVRARIKQFTRESLADTECFQRTVELTEALGRRDVEDTRARAWATGDLATLAAVPPLPDPDLSCEKAIFSSAAASDLLPADLGEQLEMKWLQAVDAGVKANETTFAVVDFTRLTSPGGFLDLLRERGYAVELPQ